MIEIDWRKAPPHATHWCPGNAKIEAGWIYNPGGNGGEYYSCYADKGLEHIPEFPEWRKLRLVPRPSKTAWDGEGLPPVGVEIEALLPGLGNTTYFWQHAKVVHGALPDSPGEVLVFSLETTRPAWVDEFRPIRTPKQIEEEERENSVQIAMGDTRTLGISDHSKRILIERLYDAGYRKQVAP